MIIKHFKSTIYYNHELKENLHMASGMRTGIAASLDVSLDSNLQVATSSATSEGIGTMRYPTARKVSVQISSPSLSSSNSLLSYFINNIIAWSFLETDRD